MSQGPVLVVDAGNALFRAPGVDDAASRAKASFIVKAMGRLGTAAMAAGARDLVAGVGFLKEAAAAAKLEVLSVNLVGQGGERLFPPSSLRTVGGIRVALVGASPLGPLGPPEGKAVGQPPVPAVLQEARRLRAKADVVVVLGALPYADALQLARDGKGLVDFVLQSHESRGVTPMQSVEGSFVLGAGDRGRQLGRLTLDTEGKGPFIDAAEQDRLRQTLTLLDSQLDQVKQRLQATTDPAAKRALQDTLKGFEDRRKATSKSLSAAPEKGRRKARVEYWTLTSELRGDADLEAQARALDPGSAH